MGSQRAIIIHLCVCFKLQFVRLVCFKLQCVRLKLYNAVLPKPTDNICALFYCLFTTAYVPCKQKVVHGIELLYNLSFSGR